MGVTFKKNLITPPINDQQVQETEKRVIDNIISSKLETKKLPVMRLTGAKTTVTYFAQITDLVNDYLTNVNSFNSIDPNLARYKQIEKFVMLFKSELTPDVEADQVTGVSVEQSGSCFVLPNTIQPKPNDFFIMEQYSVKNLYRVTNVNINTLENEKGYEISFALYIQNFDLDQHSFRNCIAERWIFEYRHIGTEFRTLFREEEFEYLIIMRKLYVELSDAYVINFYDNVLNTFLFEVGVDTNTHEDLPYTVVGDNSSVILPDVKIPQYYKGLKFYEREMIEFIRKNNIFYNCKKIVNPTQFFTSRRNVYRETIYGVLESRDIKKLKYYYFIPTHLTIATPGYPPQLFGKVDLMWSPVLVDGAINLLPSEFRSKLSSIITSSAYGTFNGTIYKSITDVFVEIIGIYIKNDPKNDYMIIDRLIGLYKNISDLEEIPLEEKFFLYPLLGYILLDIMARFSDKDFLLLMSQ